MTHINNVTRIIVFISVLVVILSSPDGKTQARPLSLADSYYVTVLSNDYLDKGPNGNYWDAWTIEDVCDANHEPVMVQIYYYVSGGYIEGTINGHSIFYNASTHRSYTILDPYTYLEEEDQDPGYYVDSYVSGLPFSLFLDSPSSSSNITLNVFCGNNNYPTATPTLTPTATQPPSSSNVLGDGDMEQYPTSSFWFPEPDPNRYDFGRLDDNSIITYLTYGTARCKKGFHIIGTGIPIPILGIPANGYADMSQRFHWSGGDLYFRYSVGAQDTTGYIRNVAYKVYIQNIYNNDLYDIAALGVPNDWKWYDRNGMYPAVPAGDYKVYIRLDSALSLPGDLLKFDDVYFSQQAVTETCLDVPIPATTVTATINATYTTYTPTSAGAAYNLILNCGFEQGNWYWDFKTGAQVIYGFANNWGYMESTTQNPGISQLFYWPGGQMYATFDSASNYNAYLQNVTTGVQYLIASGLKVSSTWVTYRTSLYVPSGSYRISLHYPAGNGPASYDNITVSLYGYASCSGGTQATMTLRPSSTSQNTATMFPTSTARPTNTMAPSSTVLANTATSTTQPTYTPYPTYTPQPTYTPYQSPVPTQTPRPQPTFTSYPTYTPQPTYTQIPTYTQQPTYTQEATSTTDPGTETSTPRPTYTPWPTYTPGIPGLVGGLPTNPPPPQPPPSYFTDCQRPQNGYDMAAWLEYNRCVALSYFDWSPNAQATLEALPGLFGNKEPLGSISEAEQTMNQLAGLVKSYDTGSAGLPGTHDQPDLGSFFDNSQPGPWTTGTWNFSQTGSTPNMACNVRVTGVLGELAKGFCWFFQILAEKGVMAWVQLFINIACIGFLLLYIWQKFIDAGSGAA